MPPRRRRGDPMTNIAPTPCSAVERWIHLFHGGACVPLAGARTDPAYLKSTSIKRVCTTCSEESMRTKQGTTTMCSSLSVERDRAM